MQDSLHWQFFDREDLSHQEIRQEHLRPVIQVTASCILTLPIVRSFDDKFCYSRATIGADFLAKVVHWDSKLSLRLQLWDIAGTVKAKEKTHIGPKEVNLATYVLVANSFALKYQPPRALWPCHFEPYVS